MRSSTRAIWRWFGLPCRLRTKLTRYGRLWPCESSHYHTRRLSADNSYHLSSELAPIYYTGELIGGHVDCILTGWGYTHQVQHLRQPNDLQNLVVKTITNDECVDQGLHVDDTGLCTLSEYGKGACSVCVTCYEHWYCLFLKPTILNRQTGWHWWATCKGKPLGWSRITWYGYLWNWFTRCVHASFCVRRMDRRELWLVDDHLCYLHSWYTIKYTSIHMFSRIDFNNLTKTIRYFELII